jgi:hypothetical protein
MAAQASAVNVAAQGVAVTGACTYRGFSIGSVLGADVVIYDGVTAAGTVLAAFTVAAKGWAADDVTDGVRCTTGIFISTSAALQGHVRVG